MANVLRRERENEPEAKPDREWWLTDMGGSLDLCCSRGPIGHGHDWCVARIDKSSGRLKLEGGISPDVAGPPLELDCAGHIVVEWL